MSYELRPSETCLCCGSPLLIQSDETSVECIYCRTRMSISRFTREEKRLATAIDELKKRADAQSDAIQSKITAMQNEWRTSLNGQLQELFRQGEECQRNGRFEKAIERYQALLVKCPSPEAEIHWRIMLCRYGIEYVREQSSGRALPTVTRMSISSVLSDDSYLCAVRHAPDPAARAFYEDEGQRINSLLMKYQQVNGTHTPYDVFISVKQGNAQGHATSDGYEALEMHHELEKMGWKVFNSRTSLKQYSGSEYEPYIMHALSTAKVLVVMASSEEYMNAPWVRNEWRRFRWLQLNNAHLPPENQHERRLIAYILGNQKWPMPELGGLQIIRAASDPTPMATLTNTVRSVCGEGTASKPSLGNMPFGGMQGMSPEQMAQFMQMFAMYQQMQGMQMNGQTAQPASPVQTAAPVQTAKPTSPSTPAQTSTPVQTPPPPKGIEINDAALEQVLRKKLGKTKGEPITEKDLAGITELGIKRSGISDISALRYCTALTKLILTNSDDGPQVTDVAPLSACKALTHLDLSGNAINDIRPLSALTRLSSLGLTENPLSDISPLSSLTSLNILFLADTNVSDVRPLAALTNLNILNLSGSAVADISPLSACKALIKLDAERLPSPLLGHAAVCTLKANGCTVKDGDALYADTSVEINDAALEQALRETLGKTNGVPITEEDLAGITELEIKEKKISDISALQYCTSLTKLNLSENQISNIGPLRSCSALTQLNLYDNQISDIEPLRSCSALTQLNLNFNQISDISSLSSCSALTMLFLGHNQISDISSLSSCSALTTLDLGNNQISDISHLRSCTSLTALHLSDNQISDITPLRNCAALTHLDLSFNQISDITPLRGCSALRQLDLNFNQISDISPLSSCSALTELFLRNNRISGINRFSMMLGSTPNARTLSALKQRGCKIELE